MAVLSKLLAALAVLASAVIDFSRMIDQQLCRPKEETNARYGNAYLSSSLAFDVRIE